MYSLVNFKQIVIYTNYNLATNNKQTNNDNSYSDRSITIIITITPISSNHYPHLSYVFQCKLFTSLSSTSFHVSVGLPLCVAPSTSKVSVIFFSPTHHHSFLKHDHTIATYFFVLRLLRLLFLTDALIQLKIVYTLISHHTST